MTGSRTFRELPLLILLGLAALVPLSALVFLLLPIAGGVRQTDVSWSEFLHGEFSAWLHAAVADVPRVLAPSEFFPIMGAQILIPITAAVLVLLYWRRTLDASVSRGDSVVLQALALVPTFVGMLWSIRYIQISFAVLAEAGLSSPGLAGRGIAESTTGTILGCVLTVALLVTYRLLRRRAAEPAAGSP